MFADVGTLIRGTLSRQRSHIAVASNMHISHRSQYDPRTSNKFLFKLFAL